MSPERAVRRLVRHVDRGIFDEYWALIDPESPADAEMQKRYQALRRSVVREHNITPFEIITLERRIVKSVPKKWREPLKGTLNALSDAKNDEMTVRELCAFLIGREIGRRRR